MSRLNLRSRTAKALLVTVALFVLAVSGWLQPVTDPVGRVVQPVTQGLSAAGQTLARPFNPEFTDRKELEAELARLRSEQSNEQLKIENQALRDQLQFARQTPYTFVGAEVIGFQPESVRSVITVNRGSRDGIQEGMAVVSNGYLVGKVTDVKEMRADVILLTDPAFRIQAISRNTRARGIVSGKVGSTVVLESVVQNEAINQGDTVVTSGSQGRFPRGLPIGTVTRVTETAGTVFKAAQIDSGMEPTKVEFTLILTDGYGRTQE